MLCVTGAEQTVAALAERLERVAGLETTLGPTLQEVRLDSLLSSDDDALALIERFGGRFGARLVVCCRPTRQGGLFRGSEAERLGLLARAVANRAALVDVEADVPDSDLARIVGAGTALGHPSSGVHNGARAQAGDSMHDRALRPTRLLLSWHDLDGLPPDPRRLVAEMLARPGVGLAKLAVTVRDPAELGALLEASLPDGRALLLGMGQAGLLSRARYPAFGSPWTYVAAAPELRTAPGQLTLDQALALGLPQAASQPFFAVLGGEAVRHSPGPRVYNSLFRSRALPWSYLPVATGRPVEALSLLRRLGARGVGVTIPHKRALLSVVHADRPSRRLGAINSIRFDDAGAQGINTDVEGVRRPLAEALAEALAAGERRCASALLLGAGGAARAAAAACRMLGLTVSVAARDATAVRELAAAGAGSCPSDAAAAEAHPVHIPWPDRAEVAADVLLNATPLGGSSCPWPKGTPIGKRVVFDLALSSERSSLLARAAAEGALVLRPEDMWAAQGAAQMTWFTGESFTEAELEVALAAP